MKKSIRITIGIAVSTFVGGILLGWLIFRNAESGSTEELNPATEKAGESIWTCSMHPQIRSSELGACPICGMDLIPVDQGQGKGNTMAVSMSPLAMQLANVTTEVVGRMAPVKSLRLNGKVQEDERLVFSQSSHLPGRIEKLMVNFTGEYVRQGQPIAYIYSPDLVTAQEELFEAIKIQDSHPELYRAAREKLRNWKLTDGQIDMVIRSGKAKEEFPINADISGFVAQKKVNLGDYISKGQSIYEIAKLSKVWVLFDIYESDIPWTREGDLITFSVASVPGEQFVGKISYIDPVIDPRTRVAKARVEISNKGLKLKPEMFVSGTLEAQLSTGSDAIVVPKSSVMWTGERSVVYVKVTTGAGISFLMREVRLGPALGSSYIIEEGLKQGDEIAVNGTFSIDAAAQLAGKPSMMNPDGKSANTGHNHGGFASPPIQKNESSHSSAQRVDLSPKAKEVLRPLFKDYLKIKDALVNDNLEEAQEAADRFKNTLAKIDMSLFTGPAHSTWMEFSSQANQAVQQAADIPGIEEMRKVFQPLSEAMIGLAISFDPFEKDLYIQHCPMANGNKGANWISLSEEIENPYFGTVMLTCGEVTLKIK